MHYCASGPIPDPGSQDCDDELRDHDKARHVEDAQRLFALPQVLSDDRQQRRLGELKQQQAAGEHDQIAVSGEVDHSLNVERVVASRRIAGAGVIDLFGSI